MEKNNFLKSGLVFAILAIVSMFGFSTAFGYGGGGGGTVTTTCSSVVYGDWGTCINGIQYRNVVSQSSSSCLLSTSQQLDRSRNCEAVVAPIVTPEPIKQVLGEKKYADGTLLRGTGNRIYVVINGKLLYVTSLKELAKYKGPILKVDDSTIASFGKAVLGAKKYADGTLLRGKGDVKIYVIKDGKKVHIKSLAELRKYKGKTLEVEGSELNNL
jgi:hypothetical protein